MRLTILLFRRNLVTKILLPELSVVYSIATFEYDLCAAHCIEEKSWVFKQRAYLYVHVNRYLLSGTKGRGLVTGNYLESSLCWTLCCALWVI